ncbi:MAG TPA: hypothetical protein VFA19_04380 [Gaiellaceae bacterium]|nr:hypothetical protein [Gaiellaceae bacterium]
MRRLDLPSGQQAEALGLVFPGVLPDGWEPIRERRTKAKDGTPGRLRGKQKAPPPDDAPPDDPDVPF